LGIKNVLCLSGDYQKFGDHPQAKNVFDIDSIQLIAVLKKMRDEGKLIREIMQEVGASKASVYRALRED